MVPGEFEPADGDIEINSGRETITLKVTNTGDRPIQIGSHYHFFEINPTVRFEREQAYGFRLDLPAATSLRLEPGMTSTVRLVAYGGDRVVYGFRGWVNGRLDDPQVRARAMQAMRSNYNPGQAAQEGRP